MSRRVGRRVAWSSTSGVTRDSGRFAAALAMKVVGLWPSHLLLRGAGVSTGDRRIRPTGTRALEEPGGGSCRFAWSSVARTTSLPSSSLAPKEREGGWW